MPRLAKRAAPVVRWAASPKRRRTSSAIMQTAKFLARAERASTRIARWYRRRRRSPKAQAFRSYAMDKGTSTALRVDTSEINLGAAADRTLYSEAIVFPQEGDTPEKRERNTIRFSGLKLCVEAANRQSTSTDPDNIYFNFAVVQFKDAPKSKSAIGNTRFFRGHQGDRGEDFPLSLGIDNHCRPINTDVYRVFYHYRRTLGRRDSSSQIEPRCKIMKYISFKKQLRFDDANFTGGQLHMVYWFTRQLTNTVTPTPSVGSCVAKATVYFRNSRN